MDWKARLVGWIEERKERFDQLAGTIWSQPELALQEHKAADLLMEELEESGFAVERGVAGMPTAFVATWGEGSPVIGLLCEYDALPGLSNETVPERKPIVEGGAGHACGHNLIGTGSVAAGIALRSVMEEAGLNGTVKVFGTPAEETLAGKVFMTREGVFDGLDACLNWHPYGRNRATYENCLSLFSVRFLFTGSSCHIPSGPELGRNALDAVELMNVATNLRRKHFPADTTIEYVVSDGGGFPNVSPDRAEVWYFLRAPEIERIEWLKREVQNAARGAALATGTDVKMKIYTGCYPYLPNKTLATALYENLKDIGPPRFDEDERAFARKIHDSMGVAEADPLDEGVELHGDELGRFSQDDGDLSWLLPVARVRTVCWPKKTRAHTWQATACTGTSIGYKGMIAAAKILATTGYDLFTHPDLLKQAKEEHQSRTQGFRYRCMIPREVQPMEEPPLLPLPE